jgi:hypothetical protein
MNCEKINTGKDFGKKVEPKTSVAPYILASLIFIAIMSILINIIEPIHENEIVVVKSYFSKTFEFEVYKKPGLIIKFGEAFHYQKHFSIDFKNKDIYFKDGNKAKIQGTLVIDIPEDYIFIIKLFMKYGSQQNLENIIINSNLQKALYELGLKYDIASSFELTKEDVLNQKWMKKLNSDDFKVYIPKIQIIYQDQDQDILLDAMKKAVKSYKNLKSK